MYDPLVKMMLNSDICGIEEMNKYEKLWGTFFHNFQDYLNYTEAPCTNSMLEESPCCNYISSITKNHFELGIIRKSLRLTQKKGGGSKLKNFKNGLSY